MEVKILATKQSFLDLENMINTWLKKHENKVLVKDIKYTDNNAWASAMIIYTKI